MWILGREIFLGRLLKSSSEVNSLGTMFSSVMGFNNGDIWFNGLLEEVPRLGGKFSFESPCLEKGLL